MKTTEYTVTVSHFEPFNNHDVEVLVASCLTLGLALHEAGKIVTANPKVKAIVRAVEKEDGHTLKMYMGEAVGERYYAEANTARALRDKENA